MVKQTALVVGGFCRVAGVYNVGFIIALGDSWAPRWVSAEVELGRFLPSVAQRFPSVSFGKIFFERFIFHTIISGL